MSDSNTANTANIANTANNPFADAEIISVYTRQQAIDDGMFVDVSKMAKEAGIKYPVAITSNLFHTYIEPSEEAKSYGQSVDGRLWDVLFVFRMMAKRANGSFIKFTVSFNDGTKKEDVDIWAVCEAQSPTDPSPAINIMLPEDY